MAAKWRLMLVERLSAERSCADLARRYLANEEYDKAAEQAMWADTHRAVRRAIIEVHDGE